MALELLSQKEKQYLEDYGLGDLNQRNLSIRTFDKGGFLFQQGSALEELMIVLEGRVKVYSMAANGKSLLYCFNDPGSIMGEVELMTGAFASSSACAITDVKCVVIPYERCRDELTSNLKFMNRICSVMAEIVIQDSINGASNILYPFESRLCAYISMTSEEGLFRAKLTELAEFFGTSYRHLLRTLDNLCQKNVLEKTAEGYRIKDDRKLHMIGIKYYSI
ncbi:MAG: cyclic nucleotide-binding protein [Bacillota bacterium]|nr:cyclic nucleotide-binding protein [Bacillota bacterium]